MEFQCRDAATESGTDRLGPTELEVKSPLMSESAQITAITPTARNPHRLSVRVGRKVVATLARQRIEALELAIGQPWDAAMAERVAEAVEQDKAMGKALNRLNCRAMSRRELDRKLRELGFAQATRQSVLDRLAELGYLDDESLGRALIREAGRGKPAGPRLLKQRLFQKGLDRDLIERLVAETQADGNETEQAISLARQRLRQLQSLDVPARMRRLHGLLTRRGFEPETIREAMEAVASDMEGEMPE